MQVKEGIDAVIVDSVLAIRKGLTEGDSKGAHEQVRLPVPTTNGTVNGTNGAAVTT